MNNTINPVRPELVEGFKKASTGSARTEIVLSATNLGKRFVEGPLDVTVLQGVDLQVHAGEILAIVGASGSGKSTLLHLLGGLDSPTTGSVKLKGHKLASLNEAEIGNLRNQHLGFVYQFHHLLAEFTAQDNVAMPLWIRRLDVEKSAQIARKILADVGALVGHRHHQGGHQIEGGDGDDQRQNDEHHAFFNLHGGKPGRSEGVV